MLTQYWSNMRAPSLYDLITGLVDPILVKYEGPNSYDLITGYVDPILVQYEGSIFK